jgi:hypothetical protein
MLWICLAAWADDHDPTKATDELPAWEPPEAAEHYATQEGDPRVMRIEDETRAQVTNYGGWMSTRLIERWGVVDGEGPVDVPTLVTRLHDGEVRDRRKKEAVGTAVTGTIGGVLAAAGVGLFLSGATERSEGAKGGAAVLAAGGAITLILGPGNAVYRSGRPDKYWAREDMQERLDDWNAELGAPVEAPEPEEPPDGDVEGAPKAEPEEPGGFDEE